MKTLALVVVSVSILAQLGIAQTQGSKPATPEPPQTAPKAPAKPAMTVIVDEKEVSFGENGVRTIGGRTFVPFRALFEAMGAEVEYDLVHKKVTATKDNNEIELTVGELIARKNGAEITMEAAPQIINKSTYVPLRFVAESLDAKVDFDGPGNKITIVTKS